MDTHKPRLQNQAAIEASRTHGTTSLWMGVLAHRRHCGEICEHLQAPVASLREQWQFQQEHQKLQERFEATGHPIYLHQQGCLAREANDYRLARLHLVAEQALLASDDHVAQAANRYELSLLASLQGDWDGALKLAKASRYHAEQIKDEVLLGHAQRLLVSIRIGLERSRGRAD